MELAPLCLQTSFLNYFELEFQTCAATVLAYVRIRVTTGFRLSRLTFGSLS